MADSDSNQELRRRPHTPHSPPSHRSPTPPRRSGTGPGPTPRGPGATPSSLGCRPRSSPGLSDSPEVSGRGYRRRHRSTTPSRCRRHRSVPWSSSPRLEREILVVELVRIALGAVDRPGGCVVREAGTRTSAHREQIQPPLGLARLHPDGFARRDDLLD